MQKRAALANFDWEEINEVLGKVNEELAEIKNSTNLKEQQEEIGDLLFSIVNVARWMGIDSEIALRKANHKFKNRFEFMEKLSKKRKIDFNKLNKKEQELLWEKSKNSI